MKTSIVVCGSGIVGMATALAFARRGQQVALLGPRQTSTAANPEHYQPRVYAISPSSQKFLTALGVWDMLPKARLTRVQAMEVFGDAQGHLNLRAWQNALPELAWIIEASEIERALVQAVQIFGLTWVTEQFTSYAPGVITTDGGTSMQAELFVAADGAQSRLRAAAGLPGMCTPMAQLRLWHISMLSVRIWALPCSGSVRRACWRCSPCQIPQKGLRSRWSGP